MDSFLTLLSGISAPLVCACISVLIAAFFAAAEIAIVFSNKTHLRELSEAGNARARTVLQLVQERDRLHSTLLLIENFFILCAAVLGMIIATRLIPQAALAAGSTVLAVTLVIVFF